MGRQKFTDRRRVSLHKYILYISILHSNISDKSGKMKFIAVLLFALVAFASAEECMDAKDWSKDALADESFCEHYKVRNYCVGRFGWVMKKKCAKMCGYCTVPTEVPVVIVVVTEAPVVETEAPVVETEPPVVVTEAPVVETEPPVVVTEAPVVVTEAPVVVETEPPVVETEAPVVVTEAPAESLISDIDAAAAAVQAAVDAILGSAGVGGDEASMMEALKGAPAIDFDLDALLGADALGGLLGGLGR